MDDLIEALTILRKYANPAYPTHCEHDTLFVNVDPNLVSPEDTQRLDELGFSPDSDGAGFTSFKFGSC
jgi:hypothetical protein